MRRQGITRRTNRNSRKAAPGFTIVELLTVVAIIIVILGIVVVAINSAVRGAQRTNTHSLLTAINQGLGQFKEETGYYPPVLDMERNLRWRFNSVDRYSGPDPAQSNFADYRDQIQEWYSLTSLADYLLGYGPVRETSSGNEFWSPDGYPGAGIRNPGADGYWGATNPNLSERGTYDARLAFLDPDGDFASQSRRFREGAVLGPYLQLRDERLLGAIDPDNPWQDEERGQFRVYLPGEAMPPGLTFDEMPKVILDYWGQPLRYFRRPYPRGQPGSSYRRVEGHDTFGDALWSPPSLSHVIALRPFQIPTGQDTDSPVMGRTGAGSIERFADANGDTTTSRRLQTAELAVLSAGPNRSINAETRVDDDELNRGNLLEIGP